jgi:DHA3 family macrolide efflux protein-like MFS transporter
MLASTTLMVPPEHLTRIQGLNQALQGALLLVAPALGALLYEALPMAGVQALDIATALVAIGSLLFVSVPRPARTEGESAGTAWRTLWADALAGMAGIGACVLVMTVIPANTAWFLAPLLAVGAMATLANAPIVAVLQATVAPEYQGRVFTLYGSLATIAVPLGLALAAPVAELLGVEAWFLAGGAAALLFSGAAFGLPAIRELEVVEAETPA